MTKRHILVVDDESSIRESLADFLRDFDMEVSTAANAEDALTLLAVKIFDVLIIDLRLPGLTGDLLIPKVHELQPAVRFLIHTGSSDYRLSAELASLGVKPEHIILKPLSDLTALIDKIERL
jgi:DNA-binding NtrC family response regulator